MKDVLKYEEFDNESVTAEIPSVKEEINGIKKDISEINSSLDNKASKNDVANISSGTPIFVDNTSKMLDTSKNYVNLSDGYVYIYNGANFEKTDILYQSQGIADNSITPNMLENGIELINLYKYPENCVEGKYINNINGDILYADVGAYAKVPVKPSTEYTFWRKSGNYQTDKGWILLCNSNGNILQKIDGSMNINGTYNNVEYVTIKTTSESAYLCFNARLSDFDDRNEIIVVEGETIEIALGIKKIFNYSLIDTLLRNKFNKFLESFKSSGSNLYNFESDYINNKYVSLDGYLLDAVGWGTAKIQVNSNTTYSIYMPNGNYSNDIGALAFYNGSAKVSFKLPSSDFINGQYNGTDYITFTTPNPCTHVYITCKRGAENKSFDNSKSLICIEGDAINDEVIKNYLTEINGYKIKEYDVDNEDKLYQHPLKGKKWVVVGDSLTEVNSRTTKNYHKYIADETGIEVINMGASGTGYKRNEEYGSAFYQRINNIPTDADIVTIFGSGNDLGLFNESNIKEVLGEVTDTTTDTICGCINVTLDNLYKRIPTARLGIVTPTPWVGYPPHIENNKMELYTQKLIEICRRRSIPVLDLYHGSNLRPWDETFRNLMYSRDDGNGVHPDENGHKQIHRFFLKFIETL
jgi:lysophospholipase L1-like esterase